MSTTHWIHHETFRPSPTLDRVNAPEQGLDLSSTFTRSSNKQRARENDVPLALVLRHDYNIQPSTHIVPRRSSEQDMSTLLTHSATHVRSEPNPFTRTAASSFYAGTGVAPSKGAAVAARVFVKHADMKPTIEPQPVDPYLSVIEAYPKQVPTKTTNKTTTAKTTTKKAASTKSNAARPSTAKIRAQIEANQRLRAQIAQQRADIATQRALELQEEAAIARYASRHIPPTPVIREMIQQDEIRAASQSYTQQPTQAWSERVPIQQVIYDHPQTVTVRPKTVARPRSASVKGKGERPSSANVRSAILDPPRGNDHFVLAAAIGFGKKHRHYNSLMKHLKSQPTVRKSMDDSDVPQDPSRTLKISASARDLSVRPSSRDTSRTLNVSSSTRDLRPSSRDTTRVSQHVEEKHMLRSQSMDPKMYQRSLLAASLGFGKAHENFHQYVRAYPEHME